MTFTTLGWIALFGTVLALILSWHEHVRGRTYALSLSAAILLFTLAVQTMIATALWILSGLFLGAVGYAAIGVIVTSLILGISDATSDDDDEMLAMYLSDIARFDGDSLWLLFGWPVFIYHILTLNDDDLAL